MRTIPYDLVINFEPDIRSNLVAALTGAPRRIGFTSAGGGPLLTDPVEHDPRAHTSANTLRLVERAFGAPAGGLVERAFGAPAGRLVERAFGAPIPPPVRRRPALVVPAVARDAAEALLAKAARDAGVVGGIAGRLLVAIHPSGGRAIKQWHPARFAEVASRAATRHGAIPVLTGSEADRPLASAVAQALAPCVTAIDLTGAADLVVLAAVLQRMSLVVTGDTGPMHLADAVGTPTVAVFGPSDPVRYAPAGPLARVVRIDLPCSPCNRIRQPPERCVGHVPDCLDGIGVDRVSAAVDEVLALAEREARSGAGWPLEPRRPVTPAQSDA